MTFAVLSPHLDDAVLSCWGVLESPEAGRVVNVFTASPAPGSAVPAWDRLTGATDSRLRMDERRQEDRRALATVGRTATRLDLLDGQYGRTGLTAVALAARLREVVEPGVTVLAPAGLGGHPDHEIVREAALLLLGHAERLLLYADLPHGIGRGWPRWVTGDAVQAGPDVGAGWDAVLVAAGLTVERLVPRVRPLDAATRERKLLAVNEYASQRRALDAMAFVPLGDPRALAFEVCWVVAPSAVGRADEGLGEVVLGDGPGHLPHEVG